MTTKPPRGWRDPERVFLTTGLAGDGPTWAFFLGAMVWWTVDLGMGPLRLVLLGTILEVTLLVAEVPTGVVADKYSRKWSVVLAFVVMGASMVMAAATLNYGVMLASQAVFGIGWTFRSGADVAWLTDEVAAKNPDAEVPDVSRIIVRKAKLGMAAGVIMMMPAVLVGRWSVRGLMMVSGVALMLVGIYAALAMTDHFRQGQPDGELYAMKILRQGIESARGIRSLRLLLLVMLLTGLGGEALDRLGFKRLLDDADVGDNSVLFLGLVFLVAGALGAAAVAICERALARDSSMPRLTMRLLAIASVGALIAALAPLVGITIGILLQDPAREALDPVTVAWANKHAPTESRATLLSLISQAHGLGEVVGGIALASLAEVTGIRAAIFVAAVLWAMASLVARLATGLRPTADVGTTKTAATS